MSEDAASYPPLRSLKDGSPIPVGDGGKWFREQMAKPDPESDWERVMRAMSDPESLLPGRDAKSLHAGQEEAWKRLGRIEDCLVMVGLFMYGSCLQAKDAEFTEAVRAKFNELAQERTGKSLDEIVAELTKVDSES